MNLFLFKLAYHNAFFALCQVIHEWLFEFRMLAQKFRKTDGIVLKEQNTWKMKTRFQQCSTTAGRGDCAASGCGCSALRIGGCVCSLWCRRSSGPRGLHLQRVIFALPSYWASACPLSFAQGRMRGGMVCSRAGTTAAVFVGRSPLLLPPKNILEATSRPKVRCWSVLSKGRLGRAGEACFGHRNHKLCQIQGGLVC